MRRQCFIFMLVLWGCKPAGPASVKSSPDQPKIENAATPARVLSGRVLPPGLWKEPDGLIGLVVPEGWDAWEGLPQDTRRIFLSHQETGIQVSVFADIAENQEEIRPRERDDCEIVFTDLGTHRLIPALYPARIATCVGHGRSALIVQKWLGFIEERQIEIEVVFPSGAAVGGRALVESLIAGLRRER